MCDTVAGDDGRVARRQRGGPLRPEEETQAASAKGSRLREKHLAGTLEPPTAEHRRCGCGYERKRDTEALIIACTP
jgi:hypothetical protein